MAEIRSFALVRHLRSEPNTHILKFKKGKLRCSKRGAALWFLPMSTSVAEVPVDDRELAFLFHSRSEDFQDVTTQGVITYRLAQPEVAASRIDFSIDLTTGAHRKQPLEKVASLLTELAQQFAWSYVVKTPVRQLLKTGQKRVRDDILAGFSGESGLAEIGIEIVSVRVSSIKPSTDLERALETKMRELIQQEADEAVFQRRAMAVEKERAIAENELQNQIELATREQQLIVQEGLNEKRRTLEKSEAQKIAAESKAERNNIESTARSQGIRLVEGARVESERDRIAIYRDLSSAATMGLAARELAANLHKIEHLSLSPDMLGSSLHKLMNLGSDRLKAAGGEED